MVRPAPPTPGPAIGVAERDRLERLRRLGYLLDNSIPIPGTRFRIGLDPLIGLIPGIGDFAGVLLSTSILVSAARLGVRAVRRGSGRCDGARGRGDASRQPRDRVRAR